MRNLIVGLLLLSGAGTFLVAQTVLSAAKQQELPARLSAPNTDGLSCSRFKWSAENGIEKAAMLVPISLSGKEYWYQLDTGDDVLTPYASDADKGWSDRGNIGQVRMVRIPHVHFAGASYSSVIGYVLKRPDRPEAQGTLGLEPLIGRTFVIDFPKQRVCLFELGDLPMSFEQAADWSDAEIRHGKLFLEGLELNGKELDGVFYDSGSSPSALNVDLNFWKEATGKSGTQDALTHQHVSAWGNDLEIIGAPATGNLKIGKHVYPTPIVITMPSRPNDFRDNYWGTGLLGNALFSGNIVILDLGAHPRFGIIDSKK
jgi:hypothetical protein